MSSFDSISVNTLNIRGAFAADDVALGGLADLAAAVASASPDAVTVQAAVISAPAALTSVAITGGESPTEAEHNAALVDIAALHAKVTALLAALKGTGKPMASA